MRVQVLRYDNLFRVGKVQILILILDLRCEEGSPVYVVQVLGTVLRYAELFRVVMCDFSGPGPAVGGGLCGSEGTRPQSGPAVQHSFSGC
jgi:hypothetical protein